MDSINGQSLYNCLCDEQSSLYIILVICAWSVFSVFSCYWDYSFATNTIFVVVILSSPAPFILSNQFQSSTCNNEFDKKRISKSCHKYDICYIPNLFHCVILISNFDGKGNHYFDMLRFFVGLAFSICLIFEKFF